MYCGCMIYVQDVDVYVDTRLGVQAQMEPRHIYCLKGWVFFDS
jgi:hypothetical protein